MIGFFCLVVPLGCLLGCSFGVPLFLPVYWMTFLRDNEKGIFHFLTVDGPRNKTV